MGNSFDRIDVSMEISPQKKKKPRPHGQQPFAGG